MIKYIELKLTFSGSSNLSLQLQRIQLLSLFYQVGDIFVFEREINDLKSTTTLHMKQITFFFIQQN